MTTGHRKIYYSFMAAGLLFIAHGLIIGIGALFPQSYASSFIQITHTPWDILLQWDAQWYTAIAKYGYLIPQAAQQAFGVTGNLLPFTPPLQAAAFFPFVPLIVHVFTPIGAVIVGNLCFYITLVVMLRLFLEMTSPLKAITGVALYALNPMLIYESAVYTETYSVLFSLLAFYGIRKGGRMGDSLAMTAGFLATLNHELGILLGIFALRYLRERRIGMMFAYGISVILGWGAYSAYLGIRFGQPLAMFAAEKTWELTWAFPGLNLIGALFHPLDHNLFLVPLMILLLVVEGIYVLRQDRTWRPAQPLSLDSMEVALWLLSGALVGLCAYSRIHPLTAVPRFLSIFWPMYSLTWLKGRRRSLPWSLGLLGIFVIFATLGAAIYTHGYFFE